MPLASSPVAGARPAGSPAAGFTLIEVLAALVVTAAFVAVVLPFTGQLLRRWSTGEATIEAADGWMQATARLCDDLSQAMPIVDPQGQQNALAFRADADRVQFVRPALGGTRGPGLDVVTLRIEAERQGDRLVRQARPYAGDFFDAGSGGGAATTILEGPYRLSFSAVGADGKRAVSWSDPKTLPARIDLAVRALVATPVLPRAIVLPIAARSQGAT